MKPSRVCIVQCDTRPPDTGFIYTTSDVNKQAARQLNYNYKYIQYECDWTWDPRSYKLLVFRDVFSDTYYTTNFDVIVYLDTDAWIVNHVMLDKLINEKLLKTKKLGMISRDPPINDNTYINSGGFIFKVNERTKQLFEELAEVMTSSPYRIKQWYDQQLLSDYIENNKHDFFILKDNILNTPGGKIFIHHWHHKNNIVNVCKFNRECEVFSLNDITDV